MRGSNRWGSGSQKIQKLELKSKKKETEINEITQELNRVQTEYLKYQIDYKNWKKSIDSILGDIESPGTINFFKTEISFLKNESGAKWKNLRLKTLASGNCSRKQWMNFLILLKKD